LAHVLGARLRFFDFLLIVTACLSVISYWAWGVFSNDLVDEKSDRITNPGRPLVAGKLNRQEVKSLSIIFLIISYLSALVVGYAFFITVFLRSCLGYLYSFYPFRLKRFPILATFVLACASLTTIWGGFLLVKQNSIYNFPVKVILLVLVAFSLGFSAKDIKDYEGDKKDNVKTIPVIFGLERGKKIIGVLSFICFLLPPIIFFQYFKPLIGFAIIAGLLSYYLITKRGYSERPLLVLYFLYAIPVALYIFNH
jgi:4-hydroxybenzoate polyprenyltransferase